MTHELKPDSFWRFKKLPAKTHVWNKRSYQTLLTRFEKSRVARPLALSESCQKPGFDVPSYSVVLTEFLYIGLRTFRCEAMKKKLCTVSQSVGFFFFF